MFRSQRFAFVSLMLGLVLAVGACSDDDDNPVNPPPTLELNSGTITPGNNYVHTFATAGSYPYFCQVHGISMSGTVVVDPASTVSVLAITINDNFFTPTPTTVDTGAVVTWTNNGGVNHTVTSR